MTNRIRPRVGIIYSVSEQGSSESRNLAHYLCGMLSSSGYAELYMIGYRKDDKTLELERNRITYLPAGKSKPVEVPAADYTYCHWNAIENCHLLVLTVNATDTESCCQKLAHCLEKEKSISVFNLQRGVRNNAIVREGLSMTKGVTLIEGVVGFAAVLDPKYSSFVSTTPRPSIMFERLSREAVKYADGPLRLLEAMNVEVSFRKILTPHAWGVLVYELMNVLNVLTKGSIQNTLSKRSWRIILALMVREARSALKVAGRQGWKPEMILISYYLNPWIWEMVLLFPTFIFNPVSWFMGWLPSKGLRSPGQMDLLEGRSSMTTHHLGEIIKLCERYAISCPVCTSVQHQLIEIEHENNTQAGRAFSSYTSKDDFMDKLEKSLLSNELVDMSLSMKELMYWFVRALAVVSFVITIGFLFVHDY